MRYRASLQDYLISTVSRCRSLPYFLSSLQDYLISTVSRLQGSMSDYEVGLQDYLISTVSRSDQAQKYGMPSAGLFNFYC